ncbi:MAG: TPM domain-containing protein [Salinibacterium sp.]|nr:TPM domain-containing protein [Salinibacterium sp.]
MPMLPRLGAIVALSAGMLFLASSPAHAEDPVDLQGAYVLDTVGAVSGSGPAIQSSLDSLYDRASIQLFVVYVDSFTSPTNAIDWADSTAIANNFGSNDLLLAVAVTDREYALSVAPDFTLTEAQLDVVDAAIEAKLRQSDWSGAAIAGAQELEAQATGVVGPGPQQSGDGSAESGGGIPILPIVGGAAVVGAGVFVYSRIRRRGKDGSVSAVPEKMTQQQLDRRAGSLLVQLDDSLTTSEQELGFAVAQFGDSATAEFTAALASARAKVTKAFTLKQQLDDAQADSAADQRAWTTEIITLCEAADAELDAQADAFDALRSVEKNAPEELSKVRAAASAVRARTDAATTALSSLTATYATAATTTVTQNLEQAAKLLDFVDASVTAAQDAIDAAKPSDAAIAIRSAQASVGQATRLYDAIDALGANLADTTSKLTAAIADTEQDIAAASALEQDPALATAIAAATAALRAAPADDPTAALAHVEKANAALEQVSTGVRDKQEAVARARTQLDATLSGARAQVQSAREYIATRRGGIGSDARTRLSEAERHLAEATGLAAGDPVAALGEAQQAAALAASAVEFARSDVNSFDSGSLVGQRNYPGSDGAGLGGILGGLIAGSGGGSRRSSSGTSGRVSRSSSFGGSSRSSSRSSSSSGGGGRRSRGGRF